MILLLHRFLRTTRLFSTDIWVPRKPKKKTAQEALCVHFCLRGTSTWTSLECLQPLQGFKTTSESPALHGRRPLAWNLTGFDLFLRTFQMWKLPWWKPLLPVAFNEIFSAKIQNLSLYKHLGNALFRGLLPSVCSLPAECPEPQSNPWISQDPCNGF